MDNIYTISLIAGLILLVVIIYLLQRISALSKRMDEMGPEGGAPAISVPVYHESASIPESVSADEEADVAAAIAAVMMLLDAEGSAPRSEDGLTVPRIRREGVRSPKWRRHTA